MRRSLVVAVVLALLGLTALAANFDSNADDITTFDTDVSVSVPSTSTTVAGPTTFGPIIYVTVNGLALTPPGQSNVTTKTLILDPDSVEAQDDPTRYITFRSPAAPAGGYLVQGYVSYYFDQFGPGANRLTAGLLDCAASELDASTGCTSIAVASADFLANQNSGLKERELHFGFVDYTVAQGREIRLKVVNRSEDDGLTLSTADVTFQYGYKTNRPSRLEISPTAP